MSIFDWNFRGKIAWSSTCREDQQEYYGWWRHIAFGLYIYRVKAIPGWDSKY